MIIKREKLLSSRHKKMLIEESGISEDVIKQRRYKTIRHKDDLAALKFADYQRNVPGLLIPVHGVDGQIVLHQFRPDRPREKEGKAIKYETPSGTRMRLDIPPSQLERIGNPNIPLIITEGVKKADSAASKGLCCIGLLGVWNWRGNNHHGGSTSLPEWEGIALNGRKVYICFDSDLMEKPEIQKSIKRLKKFLVNRDAHVSTIKLPSGPNGEKVGLDDYFAQGNSAEDLFKLIDRRSITSSQNGILGGRPAITKDIADDFIKANLASNIFKYHHYRGKWFKYNGTWWQPIEKDELKSDVMKYLREYAPEHAAINMQNNVVAHAEAVGAIGFNTNMPCWVDKKGVRSADGWLVTKSKLINSKNMARGMGRQQMNHTPRLFSRFKVDYDYDPEAKCPRWDQYLREVQPTQKDREILQMIFGLALIPNTSFEVFFMFYGPAGTGKSVSLTILENMVGTDNVCCLPLAKISDKHSMHLLTENLLNIVGDMPTNSGYGSLNTIEGTLKDVSSGGNVPVEHKCKDPMKAPAIARCIFATNSLPAFADRTDGIWDRLRIIPFKKKFRGTKEQDRNLSKKLLKELPGILNWAIKGLHKLLKLKAFPQQPDGHEILNNHRSLCDHEKEFLSSDYKEKVGHEVQRGPLYKKYQQFCMNNGYVALGSSQFTNAVQRIFPGVIKIDRKVAGKRIRVWFNLEKIGG